MNGSAYIVDPEGERRAGCLGNAIRYGVGLPLIGFLLWVLFSMCGCKSVQVSEKVNVRDSVAIRYHDSIRWQVRDSLHIIEKHVTIKDSTGLTIQFGQGGGTYNAKTGEATNVSNVQQTDTHHERKDSTAFYKSRYEAISAVSDSLQQQISDYSSSLEKERQMPKRSGYDRFCSWWFWITLILILLRILWWVADYIPPIAPYKKMIQMAIPFLR